MDTNLQLLLAINTWARSTPWLQPVMSSYAIVSGIVVFAELMFAGWWIGRKKRTRGPNHGSRSPHLVATATPTRGRQAASLAATTELDPAMEAVELRHAAVAAQVESLRRSAEAIGRDLTEFEISVTPVEQLTNQIVTDYAALGVHRLVVAPPRGEFWRAGWSYADYANFIHRNAPAQIRAAEISDTP